MCFIDMKIAVSISLLISNNPRNMVKSVILDIALLRGLSTLIYLLIICY